MPNITIKRTRFNHDPEHNAEKGYPKVQIKNAIETLIDQGEINTIAPLLEYQEVIYLKQKHQVKRRYIDKCFFLEKRRLNEPVKILTGLVPKIKEHFPFLSIEVLEHANIAICDDIILEPNIDKGITFREDQFAAIKSVRKNNRGIILAPTGTGKTVIMCGIVSCYRKLNILILAHTLDLVAQIDTQIKKLVKMKTQTLNSKTDIDWKKLQNNDDDFKKDGNVIVSTIQSFSKLDVDQYKELFDVVIVDEAHHVNSMNGTYGKVLTNILAPIRVGFTATMPQEKLALLSMEGLLGPIINQLTLKEAKDNGLLVTPKIKMHKLPYNQKINELRNYRQVIEEGVTRGFTLNNKIAEILTEALKEKKNILVFVQYIEQGEYIQALMERRELRVEFVNGEMDPSLRTRIKTKMETTKGNAVISTTVWKEGINIPSIDAIVLGGGWRSYIPIIQSIGRGLRIFDGKLEVIVHDFFDPSHNSLVSQFGERLCLYFDMGWIL